MRRWGVCARLHVWPKDRGRWVALLAIQRETWTLFESGEKLKERGVEGFCYFPQILGLHVDVNFPRLKKNMNQPLLG